MWSAPAWCRLRPDRLAHADTMEKVQEVQGGGVESGSTVNWGGDDVKRGGVYGHGNPHLAFMDS